MRAPDVRITPHVTRRRGGRSFTAGLVETVSLLAFTAAQFASLVNDGGFRLELAGEGGEFAPLPAGPVDVRDVEQLFAAFEGAEQPFGPLSAEQVDQLGAGVDPKSDPAASTGVDAAPTAADASASAAGSSSGAAVPAGDAKGEAAKPPAARPAKAAAKK